MRSLPPPLSSCRSCQIQVYPPTPVSGPSPSAASPPDAPASPPATRRRSPCRPGRASTAAGSSPRPSRLPCARELVARHDAVPHGAEKANDALADDFELGRRRDEHGACREVASPARLDLGCLVEARGQGARHLRLPRGSSPLEACGDGPLERRTVEGEPGRERPDVVE